MKQTQIRKSVARKPVPAPVKVVEIHPAEKAGIVVHQTIENGISTVAGGIATSASYVFGFVKGLVKGH